MFVFVSCFFVGFFVVVWGFWLFFVWEGWGEFGLSVFWGGLFCLSFILF